MKTEEEKLKHALYMRKWCLKNPEKKKVSDAAHYRRNRERHLSRMREWAAENRSYLNKYAREWDKKRRDSDIGYRIGKNLRHRLWKALKGGKKSFPGLELVGCSIEHLRVWLTFYFQPGMSWANYGKWHVDHVRPCANFDLADPKQQKICFHYTNLQPLWERENISKGAKYG